MSRRPSLARTRGDYLAHLRRQARLSARELAAHAGVDPSVISRAEADDIALSLGASIRIARVLAAWGATVEALTVLTDEHERPVRPVQRDGHSGQQQRPAGAA